MSSFLSFSSTPQEKKKRCYFSTSRNKKIVIIGALSDFLFFCTHSSMKRTFFDAVGLPATGGSGTEFDGRFHFRSCIKLKLMRLRLTLENLMDVTLKSKYLRVKTQNFEWCAAQHFQVMIVQESFSPHTRVERSLLSARTSVF